MSRFSAAAALAKRAVLNQFGEQMELFAADRITKIRDFNGVFLTRTREAKDLERENVDLTVLKADVEILQHIRSGMFIKHKGRLYKLDQPADLSKFSRGGVTNDHFITWFVI